MSPSGPPFESRLYLIIHTLEFYRELGPRPATARYASPIVEEAMPSYEDFLDGAKVPFTKFDDTAGVGALCGNALPALIYAFGSAWGV